MIVEDFVYTERTELTSTGGSDSELGLQMEKRNIAYVYALDSKKNKYSPNDIHLVFIVYDPSYSRLRSSKVVITLSNYKKLTLKPSCTKEDNSVYMDIVLAASDIKDLINNQSVGIAFYYLTDSGINGYAEGLRKPDLTYSLNKKDVIKNHLNKVIKGTKERWR